MFSRNLCRSATNFVDCRAEFEILLASSQQPASEVAATLLIPKGYYQKTSGLRSFAQSLNSILTPVLATALFAFAGIDLVIAIDLMTFAFAFVILLLFIHIPESNGSKQAEEKLLTAYWYRYSEKVRVQVRLCYFSLSVLPGSWYA